VETDYLNGEIVELGRRYGIATPVNELLQRRVNELVRDGHAPGTVPISELRDELSGRI
jgi:2-dehydropantoate 2-reductase